jgi:two-component system response regulator
MKGFETMNKRILLVEDNPNDEMLTLIALKDGKITNEVDVVRDGEEALNFLFCKEEYAQRDRKQMPELILLDLKLPKVDGLEVLRQIRAHETTKRIPVVILTSSREESDLMAGYDEGANSYIVKPMDTSQFTKAIEQVGLYWLIVNTVPSAGA